MNQIKLEEEPLILEQVHEEKILKKEETSFTSSKKNG